MFITRDYYFFGDELLDFPRRQFDNCIVFSEEAFPQYGNGCWEVTYSGGEHELAVFRLSSGSIEREGGSESFPKKIDWSAPLWIFDVWPGVANDSFDSLSDSSSEACSLSEREPEEDGGLDSNGRDNKVLTVQPDMEDSNSKVEMVGKLQLEFIGQGNQANSETDQGTSMKNIRKSAPTACTSSKTKRHKSNPTTAKFEGYDVRSELIPTLQKIWLNHENIMEDCAICSGEIVSKALESLATMVSILDDILVKDLSGDQVDYLTSSLADLRYMRFKVDWLAPLVEKAGEILKNKAVLESYNDYIKSISQINQRRAMLCGELAKLVEEVKKLKENIAIPPKKIPFLR